MPFRSVKQRTWMKMNKPAMYKRWKAEHGTKIAKSKKSRRSTRKRK